VVEIASTTVNAGDFVKLDYSGKTSDGKEFDSTRGRKPVLVVAGKNQLVKGLDAAIIGAEKGVKKSVDVPRDKAFGERNPELVRLIPTQKFAEQGIKPVPGMAFEIDGVLARVQSVSGGRVRVDFNHELAGLDLHYDFTVTEIFKKPEEKISALFEDALGAFGVKAEDVSFKEGVARVNAGEKVVKNSDFIARKLRAIAFALEFVPELKKIVFEEEYARLEKTEFK